MKATNKAKRQKVKIINVIILLLACIYLYSCITKDNNTIKNKPCSQKADTIKKKIEIKTFQNDSLNVKFSGWGYDIYIDGAKYIHQPHIPSINGGKGFKSKEDAERVAKLIVYKINNNIMPPSINSKELDSIGIFLNH